MAAIKAVFLDAGGTLIHLDRQFILRLLAERGMPRTEAQFVAAEAAARRALTDLIRSGGAQDDASRWFAFGMALFSGLGCNDGADALMLRILERHSEGLLWSHTVAGTDQALRRIRDGGYIIGVVSNADGRIESFLQHVGLLEHVDFVVDSGVVGIEKPDPRIFRIACDRAGVVPAAAVHVGDFYDIDVLGARASGIRPLLLDQEGLYPDADCDRITSITELPDWLARPSCS